MRALLVGAALALAAISPACAQAQQGGGDLAGTWAYQTLDYGNEQAVVAMSGVAIMTPAAPGRYDIQLIANELIAARGGGNQQIITARQNCTGQQSGGQFDISCQMAEEVEGYSPDNFVLQQVEPRKLEGVLASAATGQVTFTRVR